MGAPPIPGNVPADRIRFVDMRVRAADCEPGVEDVMEAYYTDTGESLYVPEDDDEEPRAGRGRAPNGGGDPARRDGNKAAGQGAP